MGSLLILSLIVIYACVFKVHAQGMAVTKEWINTTFSWFYVLVVAIILVMSVFLFFISSADSGSMVMDMFASNGSTDTPVWQSLSWLVVTATVTIALMYSNGLQAASIVSALPFACTLLIALWGLIWALFLDVTRKEIRQRTLNRSNPIPCSIGDILDQYEKHLHFLYVVDK